MRRLLLAGAITIILAAPKPSSAQAPTVESIKAAEVEFNAGRAAYKSESYVEAAEHFELADAHAPNDRVLELAILSRQKAGHLDRAATVAVLALERYPDNERVKGLAGPIIEEASRELVVVTVECDQPCALLDGTKIVHGQPATSRKVFLSPGKHTLRASWGGERTVSEPVDGAAGEQLSVSFTAPPIEVEPEPEPAPAPATVADTGVTVEPSGLPPLVFLIGAGLTAVAGGVTVWSGIDTLNNPGKDAVLEGCVGQGEGCPLYQEGRSKQLRTNVLLGVTGALGAATVLTGAFLTDWSGGSKASSETAGVTPWVGVGSGVSIGANGRF